MSIGLVKSHAREFDDSPIAVTSSEVIRPRFNFSDFVDTDHGEAINSATITVYKSPRMEDVSTTIKLGVAAISDEYVEQRFRSFVKNESYLVTVEVDIYRAGNSIKVKENYLTIHCLL